MKSLPNSIDLPDTAYRLPGSGLYRPAVMANNVTNLRKIPRELFKNRRGTALLEKIFCSIGGCEEAGHCQGINNDHRSVESPPCDHMYKACAGLSKTPAIRLFGESLVETLSQTSCEDAGRQAGIIDVVSQLAQLESIRAPHCAQTVTCSDCVFMRFGYLLR